MAQRRQGASVAGCRLVLFSITMALSLAGCVNAQVEQLRTTQVSTATPRSANVGTTGESIVVLGRRQNYKHQTEGDFAECVSEKLASATSLPLMSEANFVDQMFPWFEPRTAPLDVDALASRLREPLIEQRLKQTNIRYLVWLDGVTSRGDEGGSMSCGLSPAGGGCLGFMWWEKEAAYQAAVWDIENLQSVGKINVDASGTSYVPAVIVPVPLIARTQAAACSSMATQLQELLQK